MTETTGAGEQHSAGAGNCGPLRVLRRILRIGALIEDGLLVGLLAAMIVLAISQIVLRNLFDSGIVWADSVLRMAVLWVGLLGALAATRDDKQITVDVLSRLLSQRWRGVARVVTDLFTCAIAGVVAWHAGRMVQMAHEFGDKTTFGPPTWIFQLILPFGFGLISVRYLIYAVIHLRDAVRGRGEP